MSKALSETMEPDNCQDASLPQTKLVIILYTGFIELTDLDQEPLKMTEG